MALGSGMQMELYCDEARMPGGTLAVIVDTPGCGLDLKKASSSKESFDRKEARNPPRQTA